MTVTLHSGTFRADPCPTQLASRTDESRRGSIYQARRRLLATAPINHSALVVAVVVKEAVLGARADLQLLWAAAVTAAVGAAAVAAAVGAAAVAAAVGAAVAGLKPGGHVLSAPSLLGLCRDLVHWTQLETFFINR